MKALRKNGRSIVHPGPRPPALHALPVNVMEKSSDEIVSGWFTAAISRAEGLSRSPLQRLSAALPSAASTILRDKQRFSCCPQPADGFPWVRDRIKHTKTTASLPFCKATMLQYPLDAYRPLARGCDQNSGSTAPVVVHHTTEEAACPILDVRTEPPKVKVSTMGSVAAENSPRSPTRGTCLQAAGVRKISPILWILHRAPQILPP